jgi:GR25 family glycosyltransferase involved in LPS biosynthesis
MNWRTDLFSAFVNLDHRNDRLTHMNNELSRVGLQAERVRGIYPHEIVTDRSKTLVMQQRTPGAIGCHFSQVSIMQQAYGRLQHAFVMEDDLVFCSDIQDRLDYISKWLEGREWDVFWLGGTFHSPAFWHPHGRSKMNPDCSANLGRDCEKTDDPRIMRTYGAFSTFAYIVNSKSIMKILDLFNTHLHESIGIDWLFIKLQPQLKCYAFVPGCVKQIDNQSDIGNGITRFSGFSRLNGTEENSRYWFQDKMQDFDPNAFAWK